MSRRDLEGERIIKLYRQETGETDLHMPTVAEWAEARGFRMPTPLTPVQTLARRLSKAAARQTRVDRATGLPYRANVAYPVEGEDQVAMRWIDVDGVAPREKMHKAAQVYRGGLLAGSVQYTLTLLHWNNEHPEEEPLPYDTDFAEEVEYRLNATKV